MQISLPAEIQKQIDERVKSGQYRSADEVIATAVSALVQQETLGDFSAGELDALLVEAEEAIEKGEVMDGDAAFAELKRRHGLRGGKGE